MKIKAGIALDMSVADFSGWFDGTRYSVNNTTYRLFGGGEPIIFSGVGFEVNRRGQLIDGIVNKVVFGQGYSWEKTTYSGLSIDAEVLSKVIRSRTLDDDASLLAKLLAQDDTIVGSNDFDTLLGDRGNDRINGGDGNDIINGGKGNDVIIGSSGADDMTGGLGADVFFYNDQWETSEHETDIILDFSRAQGDKINLRNIGDLEFVGAAELPTEASELRYYFENGNTVIETDISGNGFQLFMLKIKGEIALTETDFIL